MRNSITGSILTSVVLFLVMPAIQGCDPKDPKEEAIPETITKVVLDFIPQIGTSVIVEATDPDGDGVQGMVVGYPIDLKMNTTYTLKITMINGLASPNDADYYVSDEVRAEGVDHMLFFGWTNSLFASPAGAGNIDSRTGAVNYIGGSDSNDANGMPLGLTTTWTTRPAVGTGTFRVILKHQPGLKSYTSGTDIGETDLDVTFDAVIH
jgi:hypothetical protein